MLGKTETGEKLACLVTGFFPYFYLGLPDALCRVKASELNRRFFPNGKPSFVNDVSLVTKTSIYGYAPGSSRFAKITVTDPKKINAVKDSILADLQRTSGIRAEVFESNIGYLIRFMVDTGFSGMEYVEVSGKQRGSRMTVHASDIRPRPEIKKLPPLKMLSLDIECIGKNGKFPSAETDEIIQIGNSVMIHPHAEKSKRVLFCLRRTNPIVGVEVRSFDTEEEMLRAWCTWVGEEDPDVLTGYNITGFDIPYLITRTEALGMSETLSRITGTKDPVTVISSTSTTSTFGTREKKVVRAPGRLIFDVLEVARREFKLHSYSLNAVCAAFLDEQKEDVHYSEMERLFEGNAETRKRLGVYCIKDSFLPLKLIAKKNLFVNYCELSRVTGVPFDYLVNRGQGVRVLSQILRSAKNSGYLLPVLRGEGEAYEGGYVMEPEKGFYTDPVAVLDFMSLYPSIIMAYNICYTTLLSPADAEKNNGNQYKSPTGDTFVKPETKQGILPGILRALLDSRKQAKKQLAAEKDTEKRAMLDARQLALKIAANSVYGFTGSANTGLPCIPISRSITAFGREILKWTKAEIEEHYAAEKKESVRVVYGDTDSVMITTGTLGLEDVFKLGREVSERVSKGLQPPLTLEFEKVYHPFLLLNKKKYAGCVKTSATDPGSVETKGIETVRRDTCALVRNLMDTCLQEIFIRGSIERTREAVEKAVHNLLTGRVGISQLVISKSLSKKEEGYAMHLGHVELAEKMRKRDPGTAPTVGDRVSYVITQGKQPLHARTEDPVYALEHGVPIDVVYYLEHQLRKPIIRLLEHVIPDISSVLEKPMHMPRAVGKSESPKRGISSFFKKKEACAICLRGPAPLCKECEPKYAQVFREALSDLRILQYKYHHLMSECQRMQHSTHTPILCCNRDCSTFYIRKELIREITSVQKKYEKLRMLRK